MQRAAQQCAGVIGQKSAEAVLAGELPREADPVKGRTWTQGGVVDSSCVATNPTG
jgi:hypothetical protein